MNEFKKMIIDLKYYLLCKSDEFILDYLNKTFKSKVDIWIGLDSIGSKCASELTDLVSNIEDFFSKRKFDFTYSNTEESIIRSINGIIQSIMDGLTIKQIIFFVKDYPTCCSIVLDRLIDQYTDFKRIKIPMYFISVGLENITYPNPEIIWCYTDFLSNLSSLNLIQFDDNEVTILQPELLTEARHKIGPNPELLV